MDATGNSRSSFAFQSILAEPTDFSNSIPAVHNYRIDQIIVLNFQRNSCDKPVCRESSTILSNSTTIINYNGTDLVVVQELLVLWPFCLIHCNTVLFSELGLQLVNVEVENMLLESVCRDHRQWNRLFWRDVFDNLSDTRYVTRHSRHSSNFAQIESDDDDGLLEKSNTTMLIKGPYFAVE